MNTLARLRTRLSYANVIATLALFFSLTGASMAGVKYLVATDTVPATSDLAGSTYGNPQIAVGKVTTDKIADGAITSVKLDGTVLAALETRVAALETLLESVSLNGNTLRLSGVNLQIVNAAGPNTEDGLGNLIIGYNQDVDTDGADVRTGSHNLVIGDEHSFSSRSGIVSGLNNTTSGPYAVATGVRNTASAWGAFIGGGEGNRATDAHAFVGGGLNNRALGINSFIAGGFSNETSGGSSFVSGTGNDATGFNSFVGGGQGKTAGGFNTCAWLADVNIVPC